MGRQFSDSEIEEANRLAIARSKQRGPTGDFALQEALGTEGFMDSMGYIHEGQPAPPQPDPFFTDLRMQTPQQAVKDWARSREGRAAIAEEAEANRPRARLWQGKDRRWYFKTIAGEVLSAADKQSLVESLIFGDKSVEEIREEMAEFLTAHPDYTADPFIWGLMSETLALAEQFVTTQTLEWAWKQIKPQIDAKALRVASDVISEIEAQGERQAYFDKMSYEQAEEAIQAVSKARRDRLI